MRATCAANRSWDTSYGARRFRDRPAAEAPNPIRVDCAHEVSVERRQRCPRESAPRRPFGSALESPAMRRFACVLLLLGLAACQSPRTSYGEKAISYAGTAGQSLKVQIIWIKHRGDQIHVYLSLLNQAREETVLDGDWLEVSTDGLRGFPSRKLPTWAMRPGEPFAQNFIFKFERKVAKTEVEINVLSRTGGRRNPAVAFKLPQ